VTSRNGFVDLLDFTVKAAGDTEAIGDSVTQCKLHFNLPKKWHTVWGRFAQYASPRIQSKTVFIEFGHVV
jgi:hypothetical protein